MYLYFQLNYFRGTSHPWISDAATSEFTRLEDKNCSCMYGNIIENSTVLFQNSTVIPLSQVAEIEQVFFQKKTSESYFTKLLKNDIQK